MKVALVAPGSERGASSLERRVQDLARGLTLQGTEVEVVTQDPSVRSPRVSEADGIVTRRFPATVRGVGFASAPGLWEHVRQGAETWDVVHLHAGRGPFRIATRGIAFATRRVAPGRLVFTPHAPIQRLLRWPSGPMVRAVVDRAACIVPLSGGEADLIRDVFPHAADRVHPLPLPVDPAAIQAARPVSYPGRLVLAGGPLERQTERLIAAMASLDQDFRLVIPGRGPAVRWLRRYADDLRVTERVDFVGCLKPELHYRWLSTARVLVTLTQTECSGSELLEALAAGAAVVASDVPANREAAAAALHAGVRFIGPECSPLELADAIAAVEETTVPPPAGLGIPPVQSVVDSMLALYRSLSVPGVPGVPVGHVAANGNGRWSAAQGDDRTVSSAP
jgi:glycosyltransferase involved in cell wall biosynthesis